MIAFESASGDPGLDATRVAAEARRPGTFVVPRPRQGVVTPFTGDAVRPVEQRTTHHDAGTNTGAEDRAEDDLGALAGAVARLREREAVGIVGDADLALQHGFEIALERLPVQAHR